MKLQSLADAARPRLSDEEICQRHVLVDVLCEPLGQYRDAGFQRLNRRLQLLILPANEDQLHIALARVYALGYIEHGARSVPAKQHDSRGNRRVEPKPLASLDATH